VADVEAAMPQLFAQMRASRPDKDTFLTPTVEAFFRDLAVRMAGLGLVRLGTLRVGDAAAATLLCFESRSTLALYNSGFDPASTGLACGLLSKAEAVRWAIAEGKETFDFLRGDEEYKRRLGGRPRQVVAVTLAVRSTRR
jgi:CelD/BcsL family acetyltransferase involved in cellulose biosynthesis